MVLLGVASLLTVAGGWEIGSIHSETTTLNFLSVGQGDCTVVNTEVGAILIDAGPATPYEDAGERIVVPWLRAHGIETVQGIFLSHPDEDHVGGTRAVLNKYPLAKLVISDQFENDPAMLGHLSKWGIDPKSVVWLPQFSQFQLGEISVAIDCPDRPIGAGTNDGSMFVRVTEGNASAVFSGDAPTAVEKKVEHDEDWTSEIVHVGHHGSRTASDPTWLDTVNPRYAIVSVGRQNRYGLPNREVLDRLEQHKIEVLRTDREGTITFRFNGTDFERD